MSTICPRRSCPTYTHHGSARSSARVRLEARRTCIGPDIVLCVARLRMKLRRMRDVYWLAANASATNVIENVTPMTVIVEPAIVANN